MGLMNVLAFLGGLAIFLFGMHTMGDALNAVGTRKLEPFLSKITSNPFKAVAVGAGITAVIQSSSATTVMVVGFVNSAIMNLEQATSVIMGANVGTTATSWILSLTGVSGDNIILTLLKPETFGPVCAIIGVVLATIIKKNDKQKAIGLVLFGFGSLMMGMDFMKGGVAPLADNPVFMDIFASLSNPLLGLLVGIAFTAAVQSSSASIGILQALILTGGIHFSSVLPIIMGQNIGTCVTALMSSVGTTKNAKRAAMIHLYFNGIGTAIFMAGFYTVNAFWPIPFLNSQATVVGIAIFHTVFNLITTAILLPNRNFLVKLANATIRGEDKPEKEKNIDDEMRHYLARLDERFLKNPSFGFEQAKIVIDQMAKLSEEGISKSFTLLKKWDDKIAAEVMKLEDQVDIYEVKVGEYLLKLGSHDLTKNESGLLSLYMRVIGDFERISDHSTNVLESAQEMYEKNETFSPFIAEEMDIFAGAVEEIMQISSKAFIELDPKLAAKAEPLEDVVDKLSIQLKDRRVSYLQSGQCSMVISFILSDLNIYLERISDHCLAIAIDAIELANKKGDFQAYLDKINDIEDEDFKISLAEYEEKFTLPEQQVVDTDNKKTDEEVLASRPEITNMDIRDIVDGK